MTEAPEPFLRWWTSRRDFLAGVAALAGVAVVVAVVIATSAWRHVPGAEAVAPRSLHAPCNDALGRPLKAKDVVAALRAEGFTAWSLSDSFYCNPDNLDGGAAVADVSNQRSVTSDDKAVDEQGWITCKLSRSGGEAPYELFVDLDRGPDSPIYAGTKSVFSLANVGCSHYPPDSDAAEWTRRALAAMKRLERRLR